MLNFPDLASEPESTTPAVTSHRKNGSPSVDRVKGFAFELPGPKIAHLVGLDLPSRRFPPPNHPDPVGKMGKRFYRLKSSSSH